MACTPTLPSTSWVMSLFFHQEIDHVAHGMLRGFLQIFAETHGNIVFGRLGARPQEPAVLMHDEAKGSGEIGFQRGDVHLAIALAGMSVAGFEERAFGRHGYV
jgi:hypothetical protein